MNLTQLEKFTIDKQMDYEINSSFPPQVTEDLKPLIEFRIKLLLKSDICIQPGESQLIQTACTLNKKKYQTCQYISNNMKSFPGILSLNLKNIYLTNQVEGLV